MPTANKLFPFLYLADLSLSKPLLYGLQQNLLFSSGGITRTFSSKECHQKKTNLKNILTFIAHVEMLTRGEAKSFLYILRKILEQVFISGRP